jgi:hypothetical protein
VYTVYLFTQGRGGGRVESIEKGQQFIELGLKIPPWLTVSPVYKFYQTPVTPVKTAFSFGVFIVS